MKSFSLQDILDCVKVPFYLGGKGTDAFVDGVAMTRSAEKNQISFVDHNYKAQEELIIEAKAGILVCSSNLSSNISYEGVLLFVEHPKLIFSIIANRLFIKRPSKGIHPSAVIHPEAQIHPDASIGPFTYVGKSNIGKDAIIYGNVQIYDGVSIGERSLIQAGCILGADGYGYNRDENGFPIQFPHIGGIIIEDDVDLGANTCIDNGALGPTKIGYGSKLDNLVHIGHNVQIGKCVYIAALTSIAGSTKVEDMVSIWTGVSVADGLRIGAKSFVGMGSVVLNEVPEGKKCFGNPARNFADNV